MDNRPILNTEDLLAEVERLRDIETAAKLVWLSRITYYVGIPTDKALVSRPALCELGDLLIAGANREAQQEAPDADA